MAEGPRRKRKETIYYNPAHGQKQGNSGANMTEMDFWKKKKILGLDWTTT